MSIRYTFFAQGDPKPGGSKSPIPLKRRDGSYVTRPNGSIAFAVKDAAGDAGSAWSGIVKVAAHRAGVRMIAGPGDRPVPVHLSVVFAMRRPQSHYRAAGTLKPDAPHYHTHTPDATKLVRRLEDALTGIAWPDDSGNQVTARKIYADRVEQVGAYITIESLGQPVRATTVAVEVSRQTRSAEPVDVAGLFEEVNGCQKGIP